MTQHTKKKADKNLIYKLITHNQKAHRQSKGKQSNLKKISIQCQKAFTLVELMLVLAIVSILISIAVPSYQSIMMKSQRVEGKTLLLEVQGQMERYYFNYQTYPDRLSKLKHYQTDTVDSENSYYQASLDKSSQTCLPVSCYFILAKHISGKQHEELGLHSNGDKEGAW